MAAMGWAALALGRTACGHTTGKNSSRGGGARATLSTAPALARCTAVYSQSDSNSHKHLQVC